MIKAIRLRRGEGLEDFSYKVAGCMNHHPAGSRAEKIGKETLSHTAVIYWEKGITNLPLGGSTAEQTLYPEIATLGFLGDIGSSPVSLSNASDPWFTDEKNEALCRAFNAQDRETENRTTKVLLDKPIKRNDVRVTGSGTAMGASLQIALHAKNAGRG
jgi:hypothetical protein